jgi:hypothetical protein
MTTIDFSAQIGGREANRVFDVHWRALKSSAMGLSVRGFPFRELAFIMRVDGEVSVYGLSGAGEVEFDKKGEYVSVDIGVPMAVRAELCTFVQEAIMSSVPLLRQTADVRLAGADWVELEEALRSLCTAYGALMSGTATTR